MAGDGEEDAIPRCSALKRLLMMSVEDAPVGAPGRDGCGLLLCVCIDADARYVRKHGLDDLVDQVVNQLLAEKPTQGLPDYLAEAIQCTELRGGAAYRALQVLNRQVAGLKWMQGASQTAAEVVSAAQGYAAEVEGAIAGAGTPRSQQRLANQPLCAALTAHIRTTDACYSLLRDVQERAAGWLSCPWMDVDYADMQSQTSALRSRREALVVQGVWSRSDPCAEVDDMLASLAEVQLIGDHLTRCDDFWPNVTRFGGAVWSDPALRRSLPLSALAAATTGPGRSELSTLVRASAAAETEQRKLVQMLEQKGEEEGEKKQEEEASRGQQTTARSSGKRKR
eukprot:TRINITY_DN6085_c1_g1_i2.p1 TRINITY_DN6085_c1_g1~~TRINITY_DN6085_c1_g1_i2.p1  ORF type:complete len:358 (+),score=115.24 TRINITY_DN6085_c1_g1_i2:60-1076(+)